MNTKECIMSNEKYSLISCNYDVFSKYSTDVKPELLSRPVIELLADSSLQTSGLGDTYVRRPTELYKRAKNRFYGPRCRKFFGKNKALRQVVKFLGSKKYNCSWVSIDKDNESVLSVCGIYSGPKYVVCYDNQQQEVKVNNSADAREYDVGEAIFHTIINFDFLGGVQAKEYLLKHPEIGKGVAPVVEERIAEICNKVKAGLDKKIAEKTM